VVQLEDVTSLDNGALFHTVDLHVHTYGASADVNDQAMTPEAVVDAAVAQGMSVLAITDHNTDANLQRAIDYATAHYPDGFMLLPGVEVTTAHGHLLCYFSPANLGDVRTFLGQLSIRGEWGARDSHTAMSMADVIARADQLGGLCVAAHIDRAKYGFEALVEGYPNWKKDILQSPGLYGLEFDDAGNLGWYSSEDQKSNAGAERRKLLSARADVPELGARSVLAPVQNSDAHHLAGFKDQALRRHLTRLKLTELSFSAVRTALVDPGARVRATAGLPERPVPRVVGMQVEGGFLDGETFHFSPNLNSFVGGRGTGKSTAVKSLAYGLGALGDFGQQSNCPARVVVYCRDSAGVEYRFERMRSAPPQIRTRGPQAVADVPGDAFRIEFYGQGDLSQVTADPLGHPGRLQEFLDRHLNLSDLVAREQELLVKLRQSSAQLVPLEVEAASLGGKRRKLAGLDKKLEVAETGRLKDFVRARAALSAERNLKSSLEEVAAAYERGLSLSSLERDFDRLTTAAGSRSGSREVEAVFNETKEVLRAANEYLQAQTTAVNRRLGELAQQLRRSLAGLDEVHAETDRKLAARSARFQRDGLAGTLSDLETVVKQRARVAQEISASEGRTPQLEELRERRRTDLKALQETRSEMTRRRKQQLAEINRILGSTIKDYRVYLRYDDIGIVDDYLEFLQRAMHGTWFQEEAARAVCEKTTPAALAALVRANDQAGLASATGLENRWPGSLVERLGSEKQLHELEVMNKPPRPVIGVLTKGKERREISVTDLSDGQRHTILLAIAMLAESSLPLVIDQPEDDLDNAFIFDTLMSTLRAVKERRQVILVTHNANIAVLGDSELLLPMRRSGDCGETFDRGSIDSTPTKEAVQRILEGGRLAFERRREIYSY